jgi:CDP-glycerol glycerophosphotransferase (TagB/SpsB family)
MSRLRKNDRVRRLARRIGIGRLILVLRLLQLPLRLPVRLVVAQVPRDPRLVVFGAPLDRFADNAAYLFLSFSRSSELRCVWITGSRSLVARLRKAGYEAELRTSLRGIRACLQARWYVVTAYVSDINRWTSDGAKTLNLWHGVPLKRIERDILDESFAILYRPRRPRSPLALAIADDVRPPDALLSTSRLISERCLSSAFGVPTERCLDFGYPRADHLFRAAARPPSDLLVSDRRVWSSLRAADFVVGYFPTWRDDDSAFMRRGGLTIEHLAAAVRAHGGVLVFKPHFNTALDSSPGSGAVVLHPDDDLNAYLPLCSVLVTDYSSVAFDFLLLERPVLYFVPDLDDYRRRRGLYFEPEQLMPGPLLATAGELFDALAEARRKPALDPRAAAVREMVWDGYAGDAMPRLQRFLESDGALR